MRKIWWVLALVTLALASPARAEGPVLQPDDLVLGKPDAPITIFEYASLSCPHCAEFDADVLPKVKAEWIDTGKAKLVFRDYPLNQQAVKAAALAHCAPPDRFFSFIDVLFHSQESWVMSDDIDQALSRIGMLGGVSAEKYTACQNDKALNDKILNSRLQAQNDYGVDSTPTFFINGKKVVGALPYPDFSKALSEASADAGSNTSVVNNNK